MDFAARAASRRQQIQHLVPHVSRGSLGDSQPPHQPALPAGFCEDRKDVGLRRLRSENRRLCEELGSLKEVYSRQMATNECKFEQRLKDKEEECMNWYKDRRHDIKKMQNAFVIMKTLFDRKQEKSAAQLLEHQKEFEAQKEAWNEHVVSMGQRLDIERMSSMDKNAAQAVEYEKRLHDSQLQMDELRADIRKLQGNLADKQREAEDMKQEKLEQMRAIEEVKKRLVEAEKADELTKKNAQIEALEAELKRTKRMMTERAASEADALRRELMEYVKFIVHLLPEEWRNRVPNAQLKHLNQHLLQAQASGDEE